MSTSILAVVGLVIAVVPVAAVGFLLFLYFGGQDEAGDMLFGSLVVLTLSAAGVYWLASLAFPALRF